MRKFKSDAFKRTQFKPRTQSVTIPPELSEWIETDGEPVTEWTVRGLTGDESAALSARIQTIPKRVMEYTARQEPPPYDLANLELALRIESLAIGSVDPVIDRDIARQIADVFPIAFRNLTDAVILMTDKGQEVV